jgi:hypothetical protein
LRAALTEWVSPGIGLGTRPGKQGNALMITGLHACHADMPNKFSILGCSHRYLAKPAIFMLQRSISLIRKAGFDSRSSRE